MSKLDTLSLQEKIKKIYDSVTGLIFAVILLFITVIMIIGVVRLFFQVGTLIQAGGITGSYLHIFTDVLTLFVLIELSRSLAEYFTSHRLRLTPVIDAGIVFVLRHIMIELFHHRLDTQATYALSALLLALGLIRVACAISFQRGKEPTTKSNSDSSGAITSVKEP
jgi:uncharacterized membrane protein (DUF373 family)